MSAQGWQRPRSNKRQDEAKSIPIADVIKYYGGEVKEGRAANIKCFMHNDSRSSAVLNTYDNLVYCHTCGKGGNGVNLLMIVEGLEFKDALKRAVEIDAGGGNSLRESNRRSHTKVSRRSWTI